MRWLTLQYMGRGRHCWALGSELPQEALGTAEEVTCIPLLCWLQNPAGTEWRDFHYSAVLSLVARVLCKTRRARACTYFKKSYQWRWYLSGMSLPTFEGGRPGFKAFFLLKKVYFTLNWSVFHHQLFWVDLFLNFFHFAINNTRFMASETWIKEECLGHIAVPS